jgi:hypothetical protein
LVQISALMVKHPGVHQQRRLLPAIGVDREQPESRTEVALRGVERSRELQRPCSCVHSSRVENGPHGTRVGAGHVSFDHLEELLHGPSRQKDGFQRHDRRKDALRARIGVYPIEKLVGSEQIVLVHREQVHLVRATRLLHLRARGRRSSDIHTGVPRPGCFGLTGQLQLFGSELSDPEVDFETRLTGLPPHAEHRLVPKCVEDVEDGFGSARIAEYGLGRSEAEAPAERGAPREDGPFDRRKEIPRPLHGAAQRGLSRRGGSHAPRQDVDARGDSPDQFLDAHDADPRGGKLDGEWDSVEQPHELSDESIVFAAGAEGRVLRSGSLEEQGNGIARGRVAVAG